jgi:hypothetical protein
MSEQAVIAHADTQAPGHPPQKYRDAQRRPAEIEEREYCDRVKYQHKNKYLPVEPASAKVDRRFVLHFTP